MMAKVTTLDLKAKLFHGFSDPSRLALLVALMSGSMTVSELLAVTRLSQSNASNHLACLRECGLVVREQEGKFVRYSLSDERVGMLLSLADVLLADVAQGVYDCTRYSTPVKQDL